MKLSRIALAAVRIACAGLAVSVVPAAASAEPKCITLERQPFCKAWSKDTPVSTQTEYVRSGETVNTWKKMITIVRYKKQNSLDAIVPTYLGLIRPYLYPQGAKPVFVKPTAAKHRQEAATRFILSSGSDMEYTVAYFRADAAPPAYSFVFSQHVTPDFGVPPMSEYGGWLHDLQAVHL